MNSQPLVYMPLAFAELLHATLGPLEDVLRSEGHPWAPMVKRALDQYTDRRDEFLESIHGEGVIESVRHITYLACEEVQNLTDDVVQEEHDFLRWASEVEDETA